MDASTFNGQAWILATEIHFPPGPSPSPGDPAYEAALVDYIARGYDARFEWTWAGQSAAWTEYMDLIESSDDYARRASRFLGIVIANHLLSGIDAFLTARIQQAAGPGTEARIRLVPMDDTTGFGWAGRGPRRLGRRGLSPGGLGLVLRVGL
jgi:hypothetical protein